MLWHAEPAERCVSELGSHQQHGLSRSEAERRLACDGPNLLIGSAQESGFARFLRQLREPLIYILLGSGAVALLLQEWVDALVIFGVVLVNAIVGAAQESRAQSAIAALARQVETRCKVIRESEQQSLDAAGLVAGDIVLLEPGDRVPADLRILGARGLVIDEAMLTGESLAVEKDARAGPPDARLSERSCVAFAGTHVVRGAARGLVIAVANATEVGRIAKLIEQAPSLATPLTRRLAAFSKAMLAWILLLAGLTFTVGLVRGESLADMLMATVALAVGAIPEGLPAALTITLAIGVSRMARRAAVIRRLPAVEALGSVTVICSDKTGTLTLNRMQVSEVHTGGQLFRIDEGPVAQADPAFLQTIRAGVLCNDAVVRSGASTTQFEGDPTETALLLSATKAGIEPGALRAHHPRLDLLPFDAGRQYMVTLNSGPEGRMLWLKGAPERVLGCCDRMLDGTGKERPLDRVAITAAAEAMAEKGNRVLAFASARQTVPASLDPDARDRNYVFLGLQGMRDPPRPEAAEAVKTCLRCGVRVVMITGDHAATAAAVAQQIGIGGPGLPRVLGGAALMQLDAPSLQAAVREISVFARVEPEQKLRLVEALQASGEIVAMTGDGVNDAPALKQADIGVAMGRGGTDVAKESADMVLTDDNFASIVAAVEEGRAVYDNLQKFMVWTLPTNFAEGLIVLVAVVAGVALPITPLQILWINMSTVLLLGLTLAFEPAQPDLMQRPPRAPAAALLPAFLGWRVAWVSILLVVLAFGVFRIEMARDSGLQAARTAAVNFFVAAEMAYLFGCRSLEQPVWRLAGKANPWFCAGLAGMLIAQAVFTYCPLANKVFDSAPLGWKSLGLILAGAACLLGLVEFEKLLRRRSRPVRCPRSDGRA